MAQVANTYDTYTSNRGRETLSDVIDRITPEDTPFMSTVGTESIDGTHPEWMTDTLATPNTANKFIQGDVYSLQAIVSAAKVGNYTQISRKEFIISETEERVSKAGPRSDYNREMVKKGIELRIDQEVILIGNQASLAGNSSTAPQTASLRAWIATNDFMNVGSGSPASGGFSAGIVAAATNATATRAFTKALMDSAISAAYVAGGNVKLIMGSPVVKSVFSTFMSHAEVAPQRMSTSATSQATIVGAADEYLSDFGKVSFVVNRQMARAGATVARNVYFLDTSKWKVGVLRPLQRDPDVAKTSDAIPGVLKVEYTLISKNEAASAVVADVTGV